MKTLCSFHLTSLLALALPTVVLPALASAQNCAQTSVGKLPLNDLGAGSYLGFQGGLYPGGTNARPHAHTVDGLAQATHVVPRDAAGAPAANGKIVFLSIGMSNCTQEFSTFQTLANADAQKNPRVQLVDGAQGGQTAAIIANPNANFWTVVQTRLTQASATAAQVQVIWFKEADAGPTQAFPLDAQTLRAEFVTVMQNIHDKFPNAKLCYFASRIYAGYATSTLNPEPYAYQQGFAVKWTIEDQIAGSAALNFDPALGTVEAPWIDWGTYNWADGLTPRSDGLIWQCSDFVADGTHPSAQGRTKVANMLFAFVHSEPTAASWYLAQPAPYAYGVGKLTSIATLPSVGWTGTPSFTINDFAFTYTDALPFSNGLAFFGPQPALAPFLSGTATLWVGGSLIRLPVHLLDGAGGSSWPIPIVPAMIGTTRFYQGWSRDASHPDGTGAVVTDGLRVVFSN